MWGRKTVGLESQQRNTENTDRGEIHNVDEEIDRQKNNMHKKWYYKKEVLQKGCYKNGC